MATSILLNNSKIQNEIADKAVFELSEKLQTDVTIGNVRYHFFNTLEFTHLYVQDLNQDTLLYVEEAFAEFNLWKFFKGKYVFNDIQVNRIYGNIVVNEQGVSNLDFIIKAFQQPKSTASDMEFNISEIGITNSRVRYTDFSANNKYDDNRFNIARLDFKKIDANLRINYFKQDSINAHIVSMSMKENSGLNIRQIETKIVGWKNGIEIPYFRLRLPKSKLELDSIQISYHDLNGLNDLLYRADGYAHVKPSFIHPDDLVPFSPEFARFSDNLFFKGTLSGNVANAKVTDMEIKYGASFLLNTDLEMNGLPSLGETFLYADIRELKTNRAGLQDVISTVQNKSFLLPDVFDKMGYIAYRGNVSGFFSNLVAYGVVTTNSGRLNTDLSVQLNEQLSSVHYSGKVSSDNFRLDKIFATEELGNISFQLQTVGSKLQQQPIQGTVIGNVAHLVAHGYNYQGIKMEGEYDTNGFNGKMTIDDENLFADFNGLIDFSEEIPIYNFVLAVNKANLKKLNFIEKYDDSELAFRIRTNVTGKKTDELNGYVSVDSIYFRNNEKVLEINELFVESVVGNDTASVTITSDMLNGSIDGKFRYSTLPRSFLSVVSTYLPSLVSEFPVTPNTPDRTNVINIDMALSHTDRLFNVLELPIKIEGNTTLQGLIDEPGNKIDLSSEVALFEYKNQSIQNLSVGIDNNKGMLNLYALGNYDQQQDLYRLELSAQAASDKLYTQVAWENNSTTTTSVGEIQANTFFSKNNEKLHMLIDVLPTQFMLNGSTWSVAPAEIELSDKNQIALRNVQISNQSQFIKAEGVASDNETDKLHIDMNELDVGYLVRLSGLKGFMLEGLSTGRLDVYGMLKAPSVESDIIIQDAKLNTILMGDMFVQSGWDKENSVMTFMAGIANETQSVVDAKGLYGFKNDSLHIDINATGLNIQPLQRYINHFLKNVDGKAYGSVTISGKGGDVGLEGTVLAKDASLEIDFLQTKYHFTDSVKLTKNTIEFDDFNIYDEDDNVAKLNAFVSHSGQFNDFKYDVKILADKFLGFNAKLSDNRGFYGKAYATGAVDIYGNETQTFIDANVTTDRNSKISFLTSNSQLSSENKGFITFVNSEKEIENMNIQRNVFRNLNRKAKGDLFVNLQINVTPNANIELVIDPLTGDLLSANGTGDIRIDYNSNSNLPNVYGNYTINNGYYIFTLQNLIRKKFEMARGSSIVFSGNVTQAQLDIDAVYSLTASLRDLMDMNMISASTGRTSIPVDLHIKIRNELVSPIISFDLDLPSSDETLKMQVKNLINTQEIMNRQVIYLLLFNQFYTPQYSSASDDLAANTSVSFLTSTLSGQLNNWLARLTNNVSLGVNYRSSVYGADVLQEYEAQVSLQPNSRFLINGNIGYRDDNLAENKIIGDLDVEYILTENGKWRIRAYNHTVDRYSLRSAPFIQGVGVMYKEEFSTWKELWQNFRKQPITTTATDSIANNRN